MSTKVVAFFNNKGGVGKTSLVYHVAWMYADLGLSVVAADLDPQANLTAAFLDDERLEALWSERAEASTIFRCVEPLIKGTGDVRMPRCERIADRLALLVGDIALSGFEDQLSEVWPKCMDGQERAFRVMSAFSRVVQGAARSEDAPLVLMDLGPNLGAINRAALLAADCVVVPLSPDLFSLQGLRNLGPTLRRWRAEWNDRREKNPDKGLELPAGQMQPIGYIVLQHSVRLDRPVKAYERWIPRLREAYHTEVLGSREAPDEDDPECLALLKHYRSLMPMAQEARKPMFHLKPADGAIGSHFLAAQEARKDFAMLAETIAERVGVPLPPAIRGLPG